MGWPARDFVYSRRHIPIFVPGLVLLRVVAGLRVLVTEPGAGCAPALHDHRLVLGNVVYMPMRTGLMILALPIEIMMIAIVTGVSEGLLRETLRRTRLIRIVPGAGSWLRLIQALAVETHEGCMEGNRYLNMECWRKLRG